MSPIVAQSIFFLKDFGQKVLQTWILRMREELVRLGPVSYTHLTLPTIA